MTGSTFGLIKALRAMTMVAAMMFGGYSLVSAHCDTMDGPVVQDARKALAAGDVTPVLKWVQVKDEKSIKAAFNKALAAQGKKQQQAEEKRFFESLVRIHRAGEGAPFTGLKPAGEVEPVIAEADKALAGGSPDGLVGMVNDAVSQASASVTKKPPKHRSIRMRASRRGANMWRPMWNTPTTWSGCT